MINMLKTTTLFRLLIVIIKLKTDYNRKINEIEKKKQKKNKLKYWSWS